MDLRDILIQILGLLITCLGRRNAGYSERIGFAVNHAGVDIISGLFDNEAGMEAYQRGKNDYYDTHPVPEGFTKEQLVLTMKL